MSVPNLTIPLKSVHGGFGDSQYPILTVLKTFRVEFDLTRIGFDKFGLLRKPCIGLSSSTGKKSFFDCRLKFQNAKSATNNFNSASCFDKMLRLAQVQLLAPC